MLDADEGGGASDERHLRTGLRQVRLRSWIASVNGERLFLKGSNHGPTRMAIAEATPDELAARRRRWRATPASTSCGSTPTSRDPSCTTPPTRPGLLLWQDLPLQWGYARGIRKQAVRQAAAAVDLLGHHPSIAIWCGHNEPMAIENDPAMWGDPKALRRMAVKAAAAQELPDLEQDRARPLGEAGAARRPTAPAR